MNPTSTSLGYRPAARLAVAGKVVGRRWEDEIERDWRNASDAGPGFWRSGIWLGQGLLSTLFARRPWRFQSMIDDDCSPSLSWNPLPTAPPFIVLTSSEARLRGPGPLRFALFPRRIQSSRAKKPGLIF